MSIWKFIVPHRDPTLLMRQFRIATGTQKSYKTDAAKKEKRRIYESNRRKFRGLSSMTWQSASEKEVLQNYYLRFCSGWLLDVHFMLPSDI